MQAAAEKPQTRSRPSGMRGLGLIVRRELGVYFRSPAGYVICALALLIDGILFNTMAIGSQPKFSAEVLSEFLRVTSGVTMVAAALISMRLIAEERQAGTLPLLLNSSLTEGEIVLAKFLSGWIFLTIILLLTLYMPLLIFIRGKVSIGHIGAGYLGLILLGGAVMAIGTFASAIAKSQIVAGVIGGAITVLLLAVWNLGPIVEGALGDILVELALWNKHFLPFMRGTVELAHIVYYVSVMAFFLVLARNALESRRWSS